MLQVDRDQLMKRRKIKAPTDLSFGLLEMAARSVNFSMLPMMDPYHQVRAARWIVKNQKPKKRKKPNA